MSHRQRNVTASATDGQRGMNGAGVYPRKLIPALRPGDYTRLEPSGETYVVDAMTPQPGFKIFDSDSSDSVSVSANDDSKDNKADAMELPNGWLGQYRMLQPGNDINDGVEVRVDQGGKEAPMYTNKNNVGEYTRDTLTPVGHDGSSAQSADDFAHNLTELYVFEDEVPYFTFENTTGSSVTVQDLYWSGFQYRLKDVSPPDGAHVEPVPTERLRQS